MESLETMWQNLHIIKKQVMDSAIAGNTDEARLILTDTETSKWREVKKNILDLISEKQSEIILKKNEVQANSENTLSSMITYSIIVVVLSFVIILLAANAFVKPIKCLELNANKVAKGDTDVEIKINSNDELGSLANSFNIMVKNIRSSIDEVNKKSEAAANAASEAEKARAAADAQKEYLSSSVKTILEVMNKFEKGT